MASMALPVLKINRETKKSKVRTKRMGERGGMKGTTQGTLKVNEDKEKGGGTLKEGGAKETQGKDT
jgi:hypothetical protein